MAEVEGVIEGHLAYNDLGYSDFHLDPFLSGDNAFVVVMSVLLGYLPFRCEN